MNKQIILASASPRRKELLTQVGLAFEVMVSDVEEVITTTNPAEVVLELSQQKALAVFEQLPDERRRESLVIGADTVVSADGKILGKPKDDVDAFAMLRSIAGRTHEVYTGVTMVTDAGHTSFYERTQVHCYPMSEEQIWAYIHTGEPQGKAGAYAIQGLFAAFVKGIEGDYNNVVGLPVSHICEELRK